MHINEILKYFNGVKKNDNNSYQCLCPNHLDKKASLTITEENNKILMYCHARMFDSKYIKINRINRKGPF